MILKYGTEDYCGTSFHLRGLIIKYSKVKNTPKKTGQFVALWNRDSHEVNINSYQIFIKL